MFRTVSGIGAVAVLLGAMAACSPAPPIPSGADRVIEIDIDGMSFVPDRLEVSRGETVAFVVNNPDDIIHELFVGTEQDQRAHRAQHLGAAEADQILIPHLGYGIYVDARGSGVLTYHFAQAGEFMIGCHLPGHWEAGMVAYITVTD